MTAGEMSKLLPEEELPLAKVSHITLTGSDVLLDNLRAIRNGRPDYTCNAGTYCRLHTRAAKSDPWQLMMSDTPFELRTARKVIKAAHGHVLILGLGIVATTLPMLDKEEVRSVTVVELNPDVIKIVAPRLKATEHGAKLEVVQGNAHSWKAPRGEKYNTIWIDIWPSSSHEHLAEMSKLRKRYTRWLSQKDPNSRILVWEEETLLAECRKDKEIEQMIYACVGGKIPELPKKRKRS